MFSTTFADLGGKAISVSAFLITPTEEVFVKAVQASVTIYKPFPVMGLLTTKFNAGDESVIALNYTPGMYFYYNCYLKYESRRAIILEEMQNVAKVI